MKIYILIQSEMYEAGYKILAASTFIAVAIKKAEEYMTSEYWELDFDKPVGFKDNSKIKVKNSKVKGWSNSQTQELLTVEEVNFF